MLGLFVCLPAAVLCGCGHGGDSWSFILKSGTLRSWCLLPTCAEAAVVSCCGQEEGSDANTARTSVQANHTGLHLDFPHLWCHQRKFLVAVYHCIAKITGKEFIVLVWEGREWLKLQHSWHANVQCFSLNPHLNSYSKICHIYLGLSWTRSDFLSVTEMRLSCSQFLVSYWLF